MSTKQTTSSINVYISELSSLCFCSFQTSHQIKSDNQKSMFMSTSTAEIIQFFAISVASEFIHSFKTIKIRRTSTPTAANVNIRLSNGCGIFSEITSAISEINIANILIAIQKNMTDKKWSLDINHASIVTIIQGISRYSFSLFIIFFLLGSGSIFLIVFSKK
ncbi:MAG: hypothetical protein ACOZBL_03685 [Patescibacteria group bacterium]